MGLSETGERKERKKNVSGDHIEDEKPLNAMIEEECELKSVTSVEMEDFSASAEDSPSVSASMEETEEGKGEDSAHTQRSGSQLWKKLRFKAALLTSKHAKRQVQSLLDSTDENGNVLDVEELTVEEAERMEIEKFMSFSALRKKPKMIVGRTVNMFSAESKIRKFCHALCTSKIWDAFVLLVVGFSIVMLVFESPEQSQSNEEKERLFWIDVSFVVFFTFEAVITVFPLSCVAVQESFFSFSLP
jgi:hypothetical protein